MGSRRRCPACGEPLGRYGCTSEPHPYKPGVERGRCYNPKLVDGVHALAEEKRVISVAGRLEVDENTIEHKEIPDACPYCARPVTATTGLTGDVNPSPGDWCICISCGEVSRYRRDGALRKLRRNELENADTLETPDKQRLVAERDRIRTMGRLPTPRSYRE